MHSQGCRAVTGQHTHARPWHSPIPADSALPVASAKLGTHVLWSAGTSCPGSLSQSSRSSTETPRPTRDSADSPDTHIPRKAGSTATRHPKLPASAPGRAAEDGLGTWVPANHGADQTGFHTPAFDPARPQTEPADGGSQSLFLLFFLPPPSCNSFKQINKPQSKSVYTLGVAVVISGNSRRQE